MKVKPEMENNDSEGSDEHDEADKINIPENTETSVSETVQTPPVNPEEIPELDERRERSKINPRQIRASDIINNKVNDEWVTGTIMSHALKSTGNH